MNPSQFVSGIQAGICVDIKDTEGDWFEARILSVDHKTKIARCHFINYSRKWDCDVNLIPDRIAIKNTHSKSTGKPDNHKYLLECVHEILFLRKDGDNLCRAATEMNLNVSELKHFLYEGDEISEDKKKLIANWIKKQTKSLALDLHILDYEEADTSKMSAFQSVLRRGNGGMNMLNLMNQLPASNQHRQFNNSNSHGMAVPINSSMANPSQFTQINGLLSLLARFTAQRNKKNHNNGNHASNANNTENAAKNNNNNRNFGNAQTNNNGNNLQMDALLNILKGANGMNRAGGTNGHGFGAQNGSGNGNGKTNTNGAGTGIGNLNGINALNLDKLKYLANTGALNVNAKAANGSGSNGLNALGALPGFNATNTNQNVAGGSIKTEVFGINAGRMQTNTPPSTAATISNTTGNGNGVSVPVPPANLLAKCVADLPKIIEKAKDNQLAGLFGVASSKASSTANTGLLNKTHSNTLPPAATLNMNSVLQRLLESNVNANGLQRKPVSVKTDSNANINEFPTDSLFKPPPLASSPHSHSGYNTSSITTATSPNSSMTASIASTTNIPLNFSSMNVTLNQSDSNSNLYKPNNGSLSGSKRARSAEDKEPLSPLKRRKLSSGRKVASDRDDSDEDDSSVYSSSCPDDEYNVDGHYLDDLSSSSDEDDIASAGNTKKFVPQTNGTKITWITMSERQFKEQQKEFEKEAKNATKEILEKERKLKKQKLEQQAAAQKKKAATTKGVEATSKKKSKASKSGKSSKPKPVKRRKHKIISDSDSEPDMDDTAKDEDFVPNEEEADIDHQSSPQRQQQRKRKPSKPASALPSVEELEEDDEDFINFGFILSTKNLNTKHSIYPKRKFRGIAKSGRRWRARVSVDRVTQYGQKSFFNPYLAAMEYDKLVRRNKVPALRGDYKMKTQIILNFPKGLTAEEIKKHRAFERELEVLELDEIKEIFPDKVKPQTASTPTPKVQEEDDDEDDEEEDDDELDEDYDDKSPNGKRRKQGKKKKRRKRNKKKEEPLIDNNGLQTKIPKLFLQRIKARNKMNAQQEKKQKQKQKQKQTEEKTPILDNYKFKPHGPIRVQPQQVRKENNNNRAITVLTERNWKCNRATTSSFFGFTTLHFYGHTLAEKKIK